jgi:large subunit ribosomal protein L15
MQTHQIAIGTTAKTKKRIGRGGKRGTYSGHGGKGQTARSGRNFKPIIREVLKRYPKLRGYKNHRAQVKDEVVNIKSLDARFENGQTVDPKILADMGLVSRVSGRCPQVKILGTGKITKKLDIVDCKVSKSAKEKIEKAGGKVK